MGVVCVGCIYILLVCRSVHQIMNVHCVNAMHVKQVRLCVLHPISHFSILCLQTSPLVQ